MINTINKDETNKVSHLNDHEINRNPRESNAEDLVATVLHYTLVQQYNLNQGFWEEKKQQQTN